MRILVLLTDAFGGHGGIAKFNRDLLLAICSCVSIREVLCLPRIVGAFSGELPAKLRFVSSAARSKATYLWELIKRFRHKPDLILCGHIHLLPLAFLYRLVRPAPIVLIIHGIDAWQPTRRPITDFLAKRIKHFVAVSQYSRRRFCEWTKLSETCGSILPNCVDLNLYGPGPKNPELLRRYRLEGRKVILTLGRLAAAERYKGFDEVLEVMPDLLRTMPNLTYMIAGDGADQARLVTKTKSLGLTVLECASPESAIQNPQSPIHVIFTGRVEEKEKADHYRLADAYVMPSRGEGFGIVFLEAMACGIPVVGSRVDGSAEALKNGELGTLVDPANRGELLQAIQEVLTSEVGSPKSRHAGLEYFSYPAFEQRTHAILASLGVAASA